MEDRLSAGATAETGGHQLSQIVDYVALKKSSAGQEFLLQMETHL